MKSRDISVLHLFFIKFYEEYNTEEINENVFCNLHSYSYFTAPGPLWRLAFITFNLVIQYTTFSLFPAVNEARSLCMFQTVFA